MSTHVDIPCQGLVLEGELSEHSGGLGLGIVVCHPLPAFGGNLHTPFVAALASAFAAAGFSSLRFNFRGVGRSTGEATGGRIEHVDVDAAIAFLLTKTKRVALCGYSFGALMAMRATAKQTSAVAGVAIGLPTVLISGKPDREAELTRAMAQIPWLLISGSRDQFSPSAAITALAPAAEILEGVGHFYTPPQEQLIIARAVHYFEKIAV